MVFWRRLAFISGRMWFGMFCMAWFRQVSTGQVLYLIAAVHLQNSVSLRAVFAKQSPVLKQMQGENGQQIAWLGRTPSSH
jgi:hypothetical protein